MTFAAIQTKQDLQEYLQKDMSFFHQLSKWDRLLAMLTCDPAWEIKRYLVYLRKEEFYLNTHKTLCRLYYFRKKNCLGNRLGIKIPPNCFGPGLTIYHHGEIIVNESARIGANCKLHGGNCIGNNGKDDTTPVIGDNLDLGFGAMVIGNVALADSVTVGAGAVVTKSYQEAGVTLAGIPAKPLRIEGK